MLASTSPLSAAVSERASDAQPGTALDPGPPPISGLDALAGRFARHPESAGKRPGSARQPLSAAADTCANLLDDAGEARPLAELEREAIRFALLLYRGRMSEVARRLGIGRTTLYRKLKEHGIGACEFTGMPAGRAAAAAAPAPADMAGTPGR